MIRKSLVLLAALFAFNLSAHSQGAIYGAFTVQRLSGINGSPLATGIVTSNNVDPIGGTFGGYYDLRNVGPVRLGIDLRGSDVTAKQGAQESSRGSGTRIYSALGGVRATFHVPLTSFKPYLQGSAGLGRSDYGLGNTSGTNGRVQITNNFEYHVYAGLDIHVLPLIDFRAAEFGYGGLDPFGTDSHNYPLYSVSTGVVVHFTR